MTERLPVVGGDDGAWGTVLRGWALAEHNDDGSHKDVFNVLNPTYGAVGDGVTDDTAAINAAVTACHTAGGGTVLLGAAHYLGTGPIVPMSGVTIRGLGVGGTTLTANAALSGGTADMIRVTNATNVAYDSFITIRDLTLDCSAQTAGNGMTLQGIDNLHLENIRVIKSYGYGITWGTVGGGTPYIKNPYGRNVRCEGCGRGVGNDSWGGGGVTNGLIDGYWCGDATDNTRPGGTAWDHTNMNGFTIQNAYAVSGGAPAAAAFATDFGASHLTLRNLFVSGWQYGVLATSTSSGQVSDLVIDGLHVESVSRHAVFFNTTATYGIQRFKIVNCDVSTWDTAAAANAGFKIEGGHDGVIANNTFGANTTAYAILLLGDADSATLNPPTYVRVEGNDVRQSTNTIWPRLISSTVALRNNPGYNPLGHSVTQPSVPATTVAQTNDTGFDCTVHVAGGTVSDIAVGGSSTGLTSGSFRVPAAQTITLTYTVAPTWVWFGD